MSIHQYLLDDLTASFTNEVARAVSLPQCGVVKWAFDALMASPARRLAERALELDRLVEQHGPAAGARWLLSCFVAGFQAFNAEKIPQDGPLLIAANHPSSYDALVISAAVERRDYKIIIGDIPPYHYLPHVCQHVIFSPQSQDTYGRMQTIRTAIQHLEDGGALLIFPRGGIEPDPDFMLEPDAEFGNWSRSLDIFLRRIPQTRVLVAIVSGVISPRALRHPVTWLRCIRSDRQRLAYIYQITRQMLSGQESFGLSPRLTFSEVALTSHGPSPLAQIQQAARYTLNQHLAKT